MSGSVPIRDNVLPVLSEFMISFGTSERDACLVAVTRIKHRHAI